MCLQLEEMQSDSKTQRKQSRYSLPLLLFLREVISLI
jgi:hypothetical protein